MNDNQSIIGFTEAELGFFVAILCIVLWVASIAATKPPEPPATISADSAAVLAEKLDSLTLAIDFLKGLQRTDSLKSTISPSCRSKGVTSGALMSLVALHDGLLRTGTDTVTLAELKQRSLADLGRARAAGCMHEVIVKYVSDLSAPELERAKLDLLEIGFRTISGGAAR